MLKHTNQKMIVKSNQTKLFHHVVVDDHSIPLQFSHSLKPFENLPHSFLQNIKYINTPKKKKKHYGDQQQLVNQDLQLVQ
jgi:hypothetical protein